jgi:hypothetical protein
VVRAAVEEVARLALPLALYYLAALLVAGLPAPVELLRERYTYGGHPASVYGVKMQLVA